MWTTEVLAFILLVVLPVYWQRRRRSRLTLLERNGIQGPKPHWLWGNLREYLDTPNVPWDTDLTHRYGQICGYYLGAKPMILTTDLSLLETIQRGNRFLDRPRRVPGGINPDPRRAEMLGNLQVPQWKVLRSILNKGFSPAKLQRMSLDTRDLVRIFISCIPEAVGAQQSFPIDFYRLYQNLTLDLIGKTGFGIPSDIQRNPNDALKSAVEQEFSKPTSSAVLKFFLCFPEFHWLLQPIRVALEKMKQWVGLGGHSELWDLGLHTVSQRKLDITRTAHLATQPPSDLLHLMIASGKLSETSMVANSVLFFEAGYETLSASLAFITHLLMTHLDVQDNVRNEIRELLLETDGRLENIAKLTDFKLLDAVIKEGLRMYPPQTTFIGRSGEENLIHQYEDRDGTKVCTIPKSVHIQVGLYQILNSPEIWEAPREFRPERFLTQLTAAQTTAYQPFGKGKRICIGLAGHQNESPEIEVIYKTATMTPKNGVFGCVVWDPLFPAEFQ